MASLLLFESITIVGAPKGREANYPCMPCGYCRQFISEFVSSDFKFYFPDGDKVISYTLDDLLPHRFEL